MMLTSASFSLADDQLARNFNPGVGPDNVGIVAAGKETDDERPQAIYAGDQGEVYLLDQLNGDILKFDPKDPSAVSQVYQLQDDFKPTDLIVAHDTFYAWD